MPGLLMLYAWFPWFALADVMGYSANSKADKPETTGEATMRK